MGIAQNTGVLCHTQLVVQVTEGAQKAARRVEARWRPRNKVYRVLQTYGALHLFFCRVDKKKIFILPLPFGSSPH